VNQISNQLLFKIIDLLVLIFTKINLKINIYHYLNVYLVSIILKLNNG